MRELSLAEIQQNSFNILKFVDKICKEEGLTYTLAYGSLLGAIRHGGFIPWDDDIDLWMPREDYNKLINYFMEHEEELKPFALFSQYNMSNYPYMISRISDTRFLIETENEESYGIGTFIDIYPIDGVGDSVQEYTKLKNKASFYSSLCFLSSRQRLSLSGVKSIRKATVKWIAYYYARFRGCKYFIDILEVMAKGCSYENSTYLGCLVWGSDGIKCIFPKEWIESSIHVSFEGQDFPAPIHHDKILQRLYGNYMALPSEEKRIPHHDYKAYEK